MAIKPNLANAIETAEKYQLRKNPPNYQQISELSTDDYVKLKSNSEYFWAKVDSVDKPCIAIVESDLVFEQPFKKGDKIEFRGENIFDIRSKFWKTNEGL